ncbi:substrate-binding domain-containing protein, partial [Phaeovulum sp. W22_SRMD_FR3]|uniref:substrate-binding domain-containing protein n=1 Tax=Phaeovulum sp. W22_SRMD_FR3 TaxID=3240274 RepID=UPI003F95DCAD
LTTSLCTCLKRSPCHQAGGANRSVTLDVARQMNQVQNFVANGVDAIIVNAVDGSATPAMTVLAVEAGIPLVYVNHPPSRCVLVLKGFDLVSQPSHAVRRCKNSGAGGRGIVPSGSVDSEQMQAASIEALRHERFVWSRLNLEVNTGSSLHRRVTDPINRSQ